MVCEGGEVDVRYVNPIPSTLAEKTQGSTAIALRDADRQRDILSPSGGYSP